MDSLILAVAIAVVVWLFMRRMRMRREQQMMQRRAAETGETPTGQKTMPRVGRPGTITPAQLIALKDNHFEPSRHWSREEAQLILDSVAYLRAVIRAETGEADPPLEIQNKVLGFILSDEELRECLLDLERNRTREEETGEVMHAIEPERDASYDRVAAFVNGLWEDE